MSLQLLRGREAKSPSRAGQEKPAASTVLQAQNAKQIATIGQAKAKPRLPFPVSDETRAFYRRFYPGTTSAEWNDWHWQFQARVRSLADLEKVFVLSEDERAAVSSHSGPLPVGITPYYASLMSRDDPSEPLRRTHIQTRAEAILSPGESDDPLGEDHDSPAPGLVHRYPDRVLFLTTGTCSTYCRYCTRARAVGNPGRLMTAMIPRFRRRASSIASSGRTASSRCLRRTIDIRIGNRSRRSMPIKFRRPATPTTCACMRRRVRLRRHPS